MPRENFFKFAARQARKKGISMRQAVKMKSVRDAFKRKGPKKKMVKKKMVKRKRKVGRKPGRKRKPGRPKKK